VTRPLGDYLEDCFRESLTVGYVGPAARRLNEAMAVHPDLQAHARETIARDTLVKERDHLSRWRLSLLTGALAHV
jgi:hypothetical protein